MPRRLAASPRARRAAGQAYRNLSATAVAGLIFGVLSPLVLLGWAMVAIPVTGIVLSVSALRKLRRAPEELSGRAAARAGLGMSIGFWAAGHLWLALSHVALVPHGYKPVAYEELQGRPTAKGVDIPPTAWELNGKQIFLQGYMYPGKQQVGLKRFLMSRDNGRCDFCMPNPGPTDLVAVELGGDLRTDYSTHLLSLGGRLRIEVDPKKIAADGVIYHLEADYLR